MSSEYMISPKPPLRHFVHRTFRDRAGTRHGGLTGTPQPVVPPVQIEDPPEPGGGPDRRSSLRQHLVYRVAKLVNGDREILCVVRNVSKTGVSVRTFGEIELPDRMEVTLANGQGMPVEKIWQDGEVVSFQLCNPMPTETFLNPAQSYLHKRGLRLRIAEPVTVIDDWGAADGWLVDISVNGAKITVPKLLTVHHEVRLDIPGLGPVAARVCWTKPDTAGLCFNDSFSFSELAEWSGRQFAR